MALPAATSAFPSASSIAPFACCFLLRASFPTPLRTFPSASLPLPLISSFDILAGHNFNMYTIKESRNPASPRFLAARAIWGFGLLAHQVETVASAPLRMITTAVGRTFMNHRQNQLGAKRLGFFRSTSLVPNSRRWSSVKVAPSGSTRRGRSSGERTLMSW
jgi:hypothetical protein